MHRKVRMKQEERIRTRGLHTHKKSVHAQVILHGAVLFMLRGRKVTLPVGCSPSADTSPILIAHRYIALVEW